MQEYDYDLIANDREERAKRLLHQKLATCGDSTYPNAYARQDILDQFRCNTCFKGHEFCRCGEGIDISDKEETE